MCIQFVYINNNPAEDGYKLIVTNNRDEYYQRPTKSAAFWGSNNHCLSGLDGFPGREGGTWFGVSQTGKIGGLLNILSPHGPLADKRPRGHLVTDYINTNVSAANYLAELEKDASEFNGFNLILIERNTATLEWAINYFSNSKDIENRPVVALKDGVHGFSNSVYSRPFQKVLRGEKMMADITGKFNTVGDKDQLLHALFDMMADKTCTLPDAQLTEQGGASLHSGLGEQRSCIYVDSSQIAYGTRTTTVFMLKADDQAEYFEKTMRQPIDSRNPQWDNVSYSFSMSPTYSHL